MGRGWQSLDPSLAHESLHGCCYLCMRAAQLPLPSGRGRLQALLQCCACKGERVQKGEEVVGAGPSSQPQPRQNIFLTWATPATLPVSYNALHEPDFLG